MIRRAALLIFFAGAAFAETPTPPAATHAAQKPVPAFGNDHPDCAQWTDGCIVCQRGDDGPNCSMAGIACLPTEPACLTAKP